MPLSGGPPDMLYDFEVVETPSANRYAGSLHDRDWGGDKLTLRILYPTNPSRPSDWLYLGEETARRINNALSSYFVKKSEQARASH